MHPEDKQDVGEKRREVAPALESFHYAGLIIDFRLDEVYLDFTREALFGKKSPKLCISWCKTLCE